MAEAVEVQRPKASDRVVGEGNARLAREALKQPGAQPAREIEVDAESGKGHPRGRSKTSNRTTDLLPLSSPSLPGKITVRSLR